MRECTGLGSRPGRRYRGRPLRGLLGGSETGGLCERKKRQTYGRLSETASSSSREKGYERVTVAEVATVVDISEPTLFRYFPVEEDLAWSTKCGRARGHRPGRAL
ncbi:TetR family transcriptional regulator [Streptomyces roseolilacinus]|uniref:TetR family transcriptional regulator n=1 Tax=Streptomyces roseolilacinus TaxID=66904 RepID=UPI003808D94B